MTQLENQWEAQSKLGMAGDGEQDTFREVRTAFRPVLRRLLRFSSIRRVLVCPLSASVTSTLLAPSNRGSTCWQNIF